MVPLRRRLGLRRCFGLILILSTVRALKLDIPSDIDVTPGGTVQISWTPAATDPESMDLFISCDNAAYQEIGVSVPTNAMSTTYLMPSINLDGQSVSCDIQARELDNVTVLDGVTVTISTTSPSSTSSESTSAPSSDPASTAVETSQSSVSSAQSSKKSQTSISQSTDTTSSSVSSFVTPLTLTSTSISTTKTSALPQSSGYSSTISMTILSTSSASTYSTAGAIPTVAPSPTAAVKKKPIGAIVGAVIGGLLLLLILAALLLFAYRRRRRLNHLSSVVRAMGVGADSAEKEQAWLGAGGVDTILARSDSPQHSALPAHSDDYTDGHQAPETLVANLQPARYSDNPTSDDSILANAYGGKDWGSRDNFRRDSSRRSSNSSGSEYVIKESVVPIPEGAGQPWLFLPHLMHGDEGAPSSSEVFDVDQLDAEAREQRREAILEQMRRVLEKER